MTINMKNTNNVLIIFLFLTQCVYAQVSQLVQNGNFENGTPQPTILEQLYALSNYGLLNQNCTNWNGATQSTADWYSSANNNYNDVLQGGCPFESAPNTAPMSVINATPKLNTPNGSLFYAGAGSLENMVNKLSPKTCKNGKVKISFWFALRSTESGGATNRTEHITASLRVGSQTLNILLLKIYDNSGQPLFTPCQWNYFESGWVSTDNFEYDELMLGGSNFPPANNPSGAFFSLGYVYYDDVNLYSGCACCPDHMQYENTSSLPPVTVMDNYIRAGFDAGIPNTSGNVIVLYQRNMSLRKIQVGNN